MPPIALGPATIGDVTDPSWSRIGTVLCDLDGVVWLAHQPIDGSVAAIAALREAGCRILFVTNNSAATLRHHEDALASIGVPARGDVISSAMAAAHLIEPGERVLIAAGAGVVEAVEARGATPVRNDGRIDADGFDAVVVGLHRDFDYERLATAAAAVRAGARLIGTNADSTYPTPAGLRPGGGSILAAVATAADASAVIAGKPHEPMAQVVRDRIGAAAAELGEGVVMVGDRPETDGLFARRIGCRFALVRSGVHDGDAPATVPVDLDAADLAAVADAIVASSRSRQ
jgi:4-nitrophenyl phosphatase